MTEKQNITQQIQTRILCGDGEKSEVMNRGGFFEWFAWLRTGRVVELKTYELRACQGGYYRLM